MIKWPIQDELPTWMECSNKLKKKEDLTSLEQFIYENEPTGWSEDNFRLGLQAVLNDKTNQ